MNAKTHLEWGVGLMTGANEPPAKTSCFWRTWGHNATFDDARPQVCPDMQL